VKQYTVVSLPAVLALSWRLLPAVASGGKIFSKVPLGWMVIPAADPDEKGLRLELGIRLDPSPLIICVCLKGKGVELGATEVYGGEKLGSLGLVEFALKFQ
jgi:hypothetical protein